MARTLLSTKLSMFNLALTSTPKSVTQKVAKVFFLDVTLALFFFTFTCSFAHAKPKNNPLQEAIQVVQLFTKIKTQQLMGLLRPSCNQNSELEKYRKEKLHFTSQLIKSGTDPKVVLKMVALAEEAYQVMHRYQKNPNSPAHSQLKLSDYSSNSVIFNGKSGHGKKYTTSPFGVVVYEPSALEVDVKSTLEKIRSEFSTSEKYLNSSGEFCFAKYWKQNPLAVQAFIDQFRSRPMHRAILIAFRGTVTQDDIRTDLEYRQVHFPDESEAFSHAYLSDKPRTDNDMGVHHGFLKTTSSTRPEIERAIRAFLYDRICDLPPTLIHELVKNTEINLTGHSLGGALAELFAAELAYHPDLCPNKPSLYLFNSPSAGNKQFADHLDRSGIKAIRINREGDIVPTILNYSILGRYTSSGDPLTIGRTSQVNQRAIFKEAYLHSLARLTADIQSICEDLIKDEQTPLLRALVIAH